MARRSAVHSVTPMLEATVAHLNRLPTAHPASVQLPTAIVPPVRVDRRIAAVE
jgi:hypothetical protein